MANVRRNKYAWFTLIIFGILISGGMMSLWLEARSLEYQSPVFSSLHISKGNIDFTKWWKSGGGNALIRMDDNSVIDLECGLFHDTPCFRVKNEKGIMPLIDDIKGKDVTAWWYLYPESPSKKLLYQLEVSGKIVVSYQYMANKYEAYYENAISNYSYFVMASISFMLLVLYPIVKVLMWK